MSTQPMTTNNDAGDETRSQRERIAQLLIAGDADEVETARHSGRMPKEPWHRPAKQQRTPVLIAAIEAGVDAQIIERGIRANPGLADASAEDGETVWEVLRRCGHAQEGEVLAALHHAHRHGADGCRGPIGREAAPWPEERITLWCVAGAQLDAGECLSGWTSDTETPAARWSCVQRTLETREGAGILAALGTWDGRRNGWSMDEKDAAALGQAVGKSCDRAPPDTVRTFVEHMAGADEGANDQTTRTRWDRVGGATTLGTVARLSGAVQNALADNEPWRNAWRDRAEAELAHRVHEGTAPLRGLRAALDLGVTMDGVLLCERKRYEQRGEEWQPVLSVALGAGADRELIVALIGAGARVETTDQIGRNAWHTLIAGSQHPDEAEVVAAFAASAPASAINARTRGRATPEDGTQRWKDAERSEARLERYRAAGARMGAETVLRCAALPDGGEHTSMHATWQLACRAPGGAAEALEHWTLSVSGRWSDRYGEDGDFDDLARAMIASARDSATTPETMLGRLDSAQNWAEVRLACALIEHWPDLAGAMGRRVDDWQQIAVATARTWHSANDADETLWMNTVFTDDATRAFETKTMVTILKECARNDRASAVRRATLALFDRGAKNQCLDALMHSASSRGKHLMLRETITLAPVGEWVRSEHERETKAPRLIASALNAHSTEAADVLLEAGAATDGACMAQIMKVAAGLSAPAVRWLRKYMGEALRAHAPGKNDLCALIQQGRRDMLTLLAEHGHGKRILRAATKAAQTAGADKCTEQGLAIIAELQAAPHLHEEALQGMRRRTQNADEMVAVVETNLTALCREGPAWPAYEGMVTHRGTVATMLGARSMNTGHSQIGWTDIDATSAMARAGENPSDQALAEALEAQGWWKEQAKQVVAVRRHPGISTETTLAMARGLRCLATKRKTGKRSS